MMLMVVPKAWEWPGAPLMSQAMRRRSILKSVDLAERKK
jgi:hypothetical protein